MAARPTEVLRPKSLAEALQLLELESVPGKSEEVEAAFRKLALVYHLTKVAIQKDGSGYRLHVATCRNGWPRGSKRPKIRLARPRAVYLGSGAIVLYAHLLS